MNVIREAYEVVAGGPLHGTTVLAPTPEDWLHGLTLAEALVALSLRGKYKCVEWRGDTYLTPCGSTTEELEAAETLPTYLAVV